MNRKPLVTRVLLSFAVVLLAGSGQAYAQQSAVNQVKAAIGAVHSALDSLDAAKMAPLWVHDASVTLINPRDKAIAVGWEAVNKNWEATFAGNSELKVTQIAGPYIRVAGNVAWATGTVDAAIKLKSGAAVNSPTVETDVFRKSAGKWLLVSHTASRLPN